MRDYFKDIPSEVLELIIQHFTYDSDTLRQCQLVNTSWQTVAEQHLYQKLVLSKDFAYVPTLFNMQLLMQPQRCKLVKCLSLLEPECMTFLGDTFFRRFPNIERVVYHTITISWKQFYDVFKPERCTLTSLPNLRMGDENVNHYLATLYAHCRTLKQLNLQGRDRSDDKIADFITKMCFFPKLKYFSSRNVYKRLQDLDTVMNRCPQLDSIDISLTDLKIQTIDWVPKDKHQQPMKQVDIFCPNYNSLTKWCTYLTAKFTSVETWYVENYCSQFATTEVQTISSFATMKNSLYQIMKAAYASIVIEFYADAMLLPEAVRFFSELVAADRNITISYKRRLDLESNQGFGLDISKIYTFYHGSKAGASIDIEVDYLPSDLAHIKLLEEIGCHIKQLNLHLPDPDDIMEKTPQNLQVMNGGALAHFIDNCPSLESASYVSDTLEAMECVAMTLANTSLKKMILSCRFMHPDALLNLSCRAPSIKDLTIISAFKGHGNTKTEIYIAMPQNNFETLCIEEQPSVESKRKSHILVKIILSTRSLTKFYIKKWEEDVREVSEKENNLYLNHPSSSKCELVIHCKSIKNIKYSDVDGQLLAFNANL